jgi:hypothetical protein
MNCVVLDFVPNVVPRFSGGIVMLSAQMWRCEYCIAALCAFAHGRVGKKRFASSDLKFLIPNFSLSRHSYRLTTLPCHLLTASSQAACIEK